MTLTLAGLLALRIPVGISALTAPAASPSRGSAFLGGVMVGASLVVFVFALGLLDWASRRAQRVDHAELLTAEPDPIESYPDAPPIGFGFSELAPPMPSIPTIPTVTPLAPIAVLHAPMGCIPVLLNPMTNSRMRIPE